jgi:hypothetical protein
LVLKVTRDVLQRKRGYVVRGLATRAGGGGSLALSCLDSYSTGGRPHRPVHSRSRAQETYHIGNKDTEWPSLRNKSNLHEPTVSVKRAVSTADGCEGRTVVPARPPGHGTPS